MHSRSVMSGRRGGGVGEGGVCAHFMHGRSRMTIDARTPTMPGRRMSGFHRPGKTWRAPSAKRRGVFGKS